MKKIGLLGGSFDPPHKGHLFISLEAKKILKLDEVWWLVTPKNPLKISEPASYQERVDNCKKITRNFPIKIQEIEKNIHSDYSYKTINYILKHYNNIKFFWLMGADNLINFHKWEKWKKIFNNMTIVIFRRHGYNTKALKSIASKRFKNHRVTGSNIKLDDFIYTPSWSLIENKEIRISSSEIRSQRKKLRGKN
ncbi:nicotinate (nicotinamide) nucleotide adenylyltransferase [Pelagibacteraceae bacterium]|nr:nicotinate (nicotinamide) nucleotide adenylyltransferase [Pelagibacteraceae bacterium]